jgi:hypothetical protein
MKLNGLAVALMVGAATLLFPSSSSAMWGDTNCTDPTTMFPTGASTRAAARSYYSYFDNEGYSYGGGCSNDNNMDDQPGQIPKTSAPRGEGPDCSGLVHWTWELGPASNTTGFYSKYAYAWNHGPFSAASFRSSTTAWTVISKTSIGYLDAAASMDHVAMYLGDNGDGTQNYFEAYNELNGTWVHHETYKSNSAFSAAHRNGWAG